MQLAGNVLKVHSTKFTVVRGVEHTVSLFFNDVPKISIVHKIISYHNMIHIISGSGIYNKPHYILNKNLKSFTIETLVFLAEIKLGWLDISWGCIETCGCKNFFNILYPRHNLLEFLLLRNSTKQLNIFMIISRGKGTMYFSRIFFFVLEFFAWQMVIKQEWTKFITI